MQRRHDRLFFSAAALLIAVSLVVLVESLSWLGRPFPGFLVLQNRVVPSAGLAHWPATSGGAIYQHQIVAIDGAPVASVSELDARVKDSPVGTPFEYTFEKSGKVSRRTIRTRRFENADYLLLFGSLLLNGLALGGTALMVRYLRGSDMLAVGSFSPLLISGLWAISAVDLYGPYRLFRIHAACECFLFAAVVHWAVVFPHPMRFIRSRPRLLWLPYTAAAALALINQIGLYDADVYRQTHQLATSAFGASLLLFIATQFWWFLHPPSFEARQRIKVVALGASASLSVPIALSLASAVTGKETPQNAMAITAIFFPISIGYAVLRHNLLEVDNVVRRTVTYAILTALVTITYVGLIQAGDYLLKTSPGPDNDTLVLFLTILFVVALIPLRDKMQSVIDRIFFRTTYDFRRIVETTSARLASVADLQVIADELSRAVGDTLHPEELVLYVNKKADSGFEPVNRPAHTQPLPDGLLTALRRASRPVELEEGALAIPCRAGGNLTAVLYLARTRSGRMYGADDRRLLQTLANQGAVAIENALALERLRDLNRDLEMKVEERTQELRDAHAQLVHREKMASLGQFVAGIAHEINNPLNFIQGNLYCLREYVDVLKESLELALKESDSKASSLRNQLEKLWGDGSLSGILEDVDSAFDGCTEGVERSTSLVADLRTFSRVDQPTMEPANLEALLDSALNLLRGKLTGIEIVRDYQGIPAILCIAGQLNQVFVNLIANSADAIIERGRITIRTQALAGNSVAIEIADDGSGIPREHLDKIFDPFFTTKEVGKGTGLGLSISYGIVTRHGGTIHVRSEPGSGTCFRIELPLKSSIYVEETT